jgi:predicted dithiol-disulfide oxidoreductase (DUF899 family)
MFPWASSLGSDFNFDFSVSVTEEQQREGAVEYNYQRGGHALDVKPKSGGVNAEVICHFSPTRDVPGVLRTL